MKICQCKLQVNAPFGLSKARNGYHKFLTWIDDFDLLVPVPRKNLLMNKVVLGFVYFKNTELSLCQCLLCGNNRRIFK